MQDADHDHPTSQAEMRKLRRWERRTKDWNGNPIIERNTEAHAAWCEKWAPRCPDGNPTRVRRALGFRERSLRELELRVALGGDDLGVCDVVVEEREDEVYVRVLVCFDDEQELSSSEYPDCPVRVWLERPLGQRAVIDVDSEDELPLFISSRRDNVRQPDHGYSPANRRRRRQPGILPGPS